MSIDTQKGYDDIKNRIQSYQTYKEAKEQYDNLSKKAGDSFERAKSKTTNQLSEAKKQLETIKDQYRSQFQELLDISRITGGKDGNTVKYLKRTFIKVLNKIRPEIDSIVVSEVANLLGCDQQQTYDTSQIIYIKVSSIDLRGSLREAPNSRLGKVIYEKNPIVIQDRPFSMNRELYQRIQSGLPYSLDNGTLYRGVSGQALFDIQYFDIHPVTGVPGGWFGITLTNRINNINKVIEFLNDYYKSIRIFEFKLVMAAVMDAITGCISIEGSLGFQQTADATTFSLFIQRILGLCFDTAREINVSGVSKLSELDEINESFFELSDLDLRNIETKVNNIINGVIEFEDCDNVKLPVNAGDILDAIADLDFIEDIKDLDIAADNLNNIVVSNPNWGGFSFNPTLKASIDLSFIELLCEGLIRAILSPKILLPLITMYKAISSNINDIIVDAIDTSQDFFKKFKKFIIALVSKIGGLFVRELFEIIKKDLFNLLQSIVLDVQKEQADGTLIIILKLTQFLIVLLEFIQDWRRCKSVIDELLKILTILTTNGGLEIPSPLLLLSQFLDGYSATRAFIGTIEEMQKIGAPTGSMPSGAPNLELLSKFGQIKAQAKENLENGKIVAITKKPATILPNGLTTMQQITGKSR